MPDMHAMVINAPGGPEALTPARVPVPAPAIGEALIRVSAAGVNPIDAKTRAGRGASALISSYPAVLGVDFCGTIERGAFAAHRFQAGDEVYGMVPVPRVGGSYAEYVTVPVIAIAHKPRSLSSVEAAAVPCAALTAWGAIMDVGRVQPGQRVLIHAAAGGVGHFAVQFARQAGAHVIGTASEPNADWLRELGADEVIDYRQRRFEEETGDIDLVVDLIGNVRDDTGRRSLSVMRPGGLLINVPSGSWPTVMEEAAAAGVRATDIKALSQTMTLDAITERIDSGAVRVHVDATLPLDEAAKAHEAIESGHTRGKIVLTHA